MSKLTTLPKIEIQARQGLSFDVPKSALAKWNPGLHAEGDESPDVITIYDIIGYEEFGGVSVKRIDRALRAIGEERDVLVRINSPGGDVFEGAAIYNRLRDHKGKVTTQNIGLAASAASLILEAGDERQTARAAFTMIHNVWALAIGNRNDLREFADFLEPFDDMLADVYAARTGMEKKKVAKMMDAETWMNGSQSIENGFADELMAADVSEGEDKDKDKWKDANALMRGLDAAMLKGGVKRDERIALMNALRNHLTSNHQPAEPRGSPSNEKETRTMSTQAPNGGAPAEQPEPQPQAAAPAASATDQIAAAVKADRERGTAIMALDEAKGRGKLAQRLVNMGTSVEDAKAILADSPKASKLDNVMGNFSPNVGGEDPPEPTAPVVVNAAGIYAARRVAAEKARAR